MDINKLEYLNGLIEFGGEITIGTMFGNVDGATAADEGSCLAMLVRKPRETLTELLIRLDEAIRKAQEEEIYTDEIN